MKMDYVLMENKKSEQDIVAEKTEEIFCDLQNKNASLFTARELFWLQYWINKVRWSTSLEYEENLFKTASELMKEVEKRETNGHR